MPKLNSSALKFIVLLGFVSLCADATYEGARSITGAYLGVLGASGTVVGLVAGFSKLIGYGLRLLTGFLSDRTRQYWSITTLGYALNTAVVPLMAFVGHWQVLAGLGRSHDRRTRRQSHLHAPSRCVVIPCCDASWYRMWVWSA